MMHSLASVVQGPTPDAQRRPAVRTGVGSVRASQGTCQSGLERWHEGPGPARLAGGGARAGPPWRHLCLAAAGRGRGADGRAAGKADGVKGSGRGADLTVAQSGRPGSRGQGHRPGNP